MVCIFFGEISLYVFDGVCVHQELSVLLASCEYPDVEVYSPFTRDPQYSLGKYFRLITTRSRLVSFHPHIGNLKTAQYIEGSLKT